MDLFELALAKKLAGGGGGGGGGDSDFSTATLSFNMQTGYMATIEMLICIMGGEDLAAMQGAGAIAFATYDIVLYKGSQTITVYDSAQITTIPPNAEVIDFYEEDDAWVYVLKIKGDCTLTLTGWAGN